MKNRNNQKEKILNKVLIAIIALISSFVVLVGATYAWITLSTAPEIKGVETKIGANGSLEIALINSDSFNNLSNIETNIGDSNVVKSLKDSNVTWGNIVDLADDSYGLKQISLNPSVLNVDDGYIGTSILKTAEFGADGRISKLCDTINAIYNNGNFTENDTDYGVRAIGTSNSLSIQESALRNARSSINSGINLTKKYAIDGFNKYGGQIMDIIIDHKSNNKIFYSKDDVMSIKNYILSLKQSLYYSRNVVKQGIIAFLCSQNISNEQFLVLKNQIEKASDLKSIEAIAQINNFDSISNLIENDELLIDEIINDCDELIENDSYSFNDLENIINRIINPNYIVFNGYSIDEAMENENEILNEILTDGLLQIDINANSSLASDIATLSGEYECKTIVNSLSNITTRVIFNQNSEISYLDSIKLFVENVKSNQNAIYDISIDDTYGYVIDLAFRTNVSDSYLLLEQEGSQRIYSDSTNYETMGLGSFMSFHSNSLDEEKMVELMNAIRVAFVREDNLLLAIGKLNITDLYKTEDDSLAARLYLYDYHVENGNILIDARKKDDSKIIELYKNTPIAISCIVFLDGNYVDNTMVSAVLKKTMTGVLNLQFASSADLVPMSVTQMYSLSTNLESLSTVLKSYETAYSANNKNKRYIQVLFDDFVREYEYCNSLLNSKDVSTSIIRNALYNLNLAYESLELTDDTTLESLLNKAYNEYGLNVEYDEVEARYYLPSVESYQVENELYKLYVGTYRNSNRKAYESALIEAYTLSQKILNNDIVSDEEIANCIGVLNAANKVMQANKYTDYYPYILNDTIYYRGENDSWYFKNNDLFNQITAQDTIITLDNNATKVNMSEYRQLLHKDSDGDNNLQNYYFGSDGYWYEKVCKVISYKYNQDNNKYVEESYETIYQSNMENGHWIWEIYDGFDIVSNSYFRRVDSEKENLIKSAKASSNIVINKTKMAVNSSIEDIYVNLSSISETILNVEFSTNSSNVVSIISSGNHATITSKNEPALIILNAKILTNNGNEYVCYKEIEIVSFSEFEYEEKTYYLGSDNCWYFSMNINDVVNNESLILNLNNLTQ